MTGQEHEMILKAGRVATIHNAIRESALRGKSIDNIVQKMEDALDDLLEAYFLYQEWKKENEASKN